MKVSLTIECKCGNYDSLILNRTVNKTDDGKVYEDYSSLTGTKFRNEFFTWKQYCENEVEVTCKECGARHDITT